MKKNLFLSMSLLAIAGVWTGCSIDEEVTTPAQLQSREVTFGVQGATPQVVSRTTGTTAEYVDAFVVSGTDDKTSMGVEGIYGDNKRTHFWNFSIARSADGSYDYSPKRYYQNGAMKATFFAYSPVSNNVKHAGVAGADVDNLRGEVDGAPDPFVTFDYKVEMPDPNGDTSQEDLLVAWADVDEAGIYGNKKVQLDFVHALSRVFVTGQNKTTTPVRIKNLQFVNLFKDGTATVTGATTGLGMPVGGSGDDFEPVDDVVKWSDHQNRVTDGDDVYGKYRYLLPESGVFLEASMKHGEANEAKWLVAKEQGMMVIPQTLLGNLPVKAAADIKVSADIVAAALANVAAGWAAIDAATATNAAAVTATTTATTAVTIGEIAALAAGYDYTVSNTGTLNAILNTAYEYGPTAAEETDAANAASSAATITAAAGKVTNVDVTITIIHAAPGHAGSGIVGSADYVPGITEAGKNAYEEDYEAAYKETYKSKYEAVYAERIRLNDTAADAAIAADGAARGAANTAGKEKGLAARQLTVAQTKYAAIKADMKKEVIAAAVEKIDKDAATIAKDVAAIAAGLADVKAAAETLAKATNDSEAEVAAAAKTFKAAYDKAVEYVAAAVEASKKAVADAASAQAFVTAANSATKYQNVYDALKDAQKALVGDVAATSGANFNLVATQTALNNALTAGTYKDPADDTDKLNILTAVHEKALLVAEKEIGSSKFTAAAVTADATAITGAVGQAAVKTTAATAATAAAAAAIEAAKALSTIYTTAPDGDQFALRVDYELSNITQTTYISLGNDFEFEPSKQYLINLVIEGREISFDVKVAGFADPEDVTWLYTNAY